MRLARVKQERGPPTIMTCFLRRERLKVGSLGCYECVFCLQVLGSK